MRTNLAAALFLMFVLTLACENPQTGVAYEPPTQVQWSYDHHENINVPVCGPGAETRWFDGGGNPTISVDLLLVVECHWRCAFYLTDDGRVGPRRYRKRWVHYSDGWMVQAGDFSEDCGDGLLGGGAWDYEPAP